ncbi:hypothetical protein [Paenibacillus sp. UNC499MF]|uniref:hypothetical protein n=1 Tax=Paenibacillus sp. UNC499MF TaxID=1502751 RepID=UPI00089FF177|nr:hypothetical protein [Paenibacillus sp. UNC499MF]SEG78728.1 hypothetical protein SAMN02799616_05131 [Paenibacillus sp. UNC499MF]
MELETKIDALFQELNFEKVSVSGTPLFLHNGLYIKITLVRGLKSYVVESADSYDKAAKNVFEDSDLYSISLNEDELIDKLRHDLLNYY